MTRTLDRLPEIADLIEVLDTDTGQWRAAVVISMHACRELSPHLWRDGFGKTWSNNEAHAYGPDDTIRAFRHIDDGSATFCIMRFRGRPSNPLYDEPQHYEYNRNVRVPDESPIHDKTYDEVRAMWAHREVTDQQIYIWFRRWVIGKAEYRIDPSTARGQELHGDAWVDLAWVNNP